jgi:hypothetical protein
MQADVSPSALELAARTLQSEHEFRTPADTHTGVWTLGDGGSTGLCDAHWSAPISVKPRQANTAEVSRFNPSDPFGPDAPLSSAVNDALGRLTDEMTTNGNVDLVLLVGGGDTCLDHYELSPEVLNVAWERNATIDFYLVLAESSEPNDGEVAQFTILREALVDFAQEGGGVVSLFLCSPPLDGAIKSFTLDELCR